MIIAKLAFPPKKIRMMSCRPNPNIWTPRRLNTFFSLAGEEGESGFPE
jgi:hypothetical protein